MTTPPTRAAALQTDVTSADQTLVNLARQTRPLVGWWWGVRRTDGVMGAYCYVCGTVICNGALNVGISAAQQAQISEHRAGHYGEIRKARKAAGR